MISYSKHTYTCLASDIPGFQVQNFHKSVIDSVQSPARLGVVEEDVDKQSRPINGVEVVYQLIGNMSHSKASWLKDTLSKVTLPLMLQEG